MSLLEHLIIPDWPAPKNVRALQTTRLGGISSAPYNSLNLGDHVGDAPLSVARNRMLLNILLPSEPVWLEQVHGIRVANADMAGCLPQADACIARHRDAVCVVMTADCLPLLLCDPQGSVVGAAHAGWKGLAAGVVEATVQAMDVAPQNLMAWLGPAISQPAFEVGAEVRDTFVDADPQAAAAFTPSPLKGEGGVTNDLAVVVGQPRQMAGSSIREGKKWSADLYALTRLRLNALGITRIYGGGYCTYRERERFFSYRRDGVTGRMGTFIWLD
ncbi:MAG: peptidoglycan editing factor PgeF [Gallionella sp.]